MERRVGHAGTLDPIATGVLPVFFGQATRMVEFLQQQPKTYRAEIELGIATDTYDGAGRVVQKSDAVNVSRSQFEEAFRGFQGVIQQKPPMHSAVRHRGIHLYEIARAGLEVERPSRPVEVYETKLLAFDAPLATIEIVCGKGTYVRAIAHDLGQVLGCGAHLRSLSRLRYGPFTIDEAVSVAALEEAFRQERWRDLLSPMDSVLADSLALELDRDAERLVLSGRSLPPSQPGLAGDAGGGLARAYGADGRLLAVLSFDADRQVWRPRKVFARAAQG